jgi:tetrahydromethanopterin S-methyltransferase subunit E
MHLLAKMVPIVDLFILFCGPLINRYTLRADIVSTMLFTLLCAVSLGVFLNMRVHETFAATAAYAAILLVLVQTER